MSCRRVVGDAAERAAPIAWRSEDDPRRGTSTPSPAAAPSVDEADLRLAQAEQQGYQRGAAEARLQCEAAHRQEWERLAHAVEQTASFKPRLRQETEIEVVRLAVTIAHRILRREVSVDPGAIEGIVKAALERVSLAEVTRVRTSPASRATLESALGRIGPAVSIRIEADPALEPGSVQIDTSRGTLDASIEGQLSEIERGFADLLGSHS